MHYFSVHFSDSVLFASLTVFVIVKRLLSAFTFVIYSSDSILYAYINVYIHFDVLIR